MPLSQLEDARRLSEEPLKATLSKADRSDLPRDVSLSSEAEELIAAWNGGKVKHNDGDATAAPQATHEYHQQDQNTEKEGPEGSMQVGDQHCVLSQLTLLLAAVFSDSAPVL